MSGKRPTKKDLEEKFHLDMSFEDAIKQMMNIPTELIFTIDDIYPANEIIIGNKSGLDLRNYDFEVSIFFDDNPIPNRVFSLNEFLLSKEQKVGISVHIPIPVAFSKAKIILKNNSDKPVNRESLFIIARDPGSDRLKSF